eukprot:scaffold20264_cov65-Phaeocystis_antarctica.AAC.6
MTAGGFSGFSLSSVLTETGAPLQRGSRIFSPNANPGLPLGVETVRATSVVLWRSALSSAASQFVVTVYEEGTEQQTRVCGLAEAFAISRPLFQQEIYLLEGSLAPAWRTIHGCLMRYSSDVSPRRARGQV